MKAIVCTRYGPPAGLEFKEIATPVPADNEMLIRVYAASVNPLDSFIMRGPLFFVPIVGKRIKPKYEVPGADVAGRVETVGRRVTQFQPGDDVFGSLFEGKKMGAFAEYVCAAENQLGLKPINLSFEQAAAVPVAAITALQALRDKGNIQPGHKVLVDGASGGVGTFAVQIAKSFGVEVTAVVSARQLETARSIGADHVIDYSREDFTKSGRRYDLILGANAHHSIFAYRRALTPRGTVVIIGGGVAYILQAAVLGPLLSRIGRKKLRFFIAKISTRDLVFLKSLLESGQVTPIIDRCYPLAETAEALRYREEGHARGKIVITVEHCEPRDGVVQ